MRVLHVASECSPLVKVGGLADVVYSLALHQHQQGLDVEIALPKYGWINQLESVEKIPDHRCTLWRGVYKNLKFILLEPHDEDYFLRKDVYGYKDDLLRFICFGARIASYAKNFQGVVQVHDWHAALLAPLLKEHHKKGIILTIHNLHYQGKCRPIDLNHFGIDGEKYHKETFLQDPEQKDLINILKGGIVFSDVVNTVSPTYAKEILTPEFGNGLHQILHDQRKKLFGVLNGIDENDWSPVSDPYLKPHLPKTFSVNELINWKKEMRKKLPIPFDPQKPLVISIGRLTKQKGPSLIKEALTRTIEKGGQFILLGSPSDPYVTEEFFQLKKTYASDPNVLFHFDFDESFAHQLYASADILVVPSLFEPCGITQMISLRYGTLPLVRKTGGLADTVFDPLDKHPKPNGFSFTPFTEQALCETLCRAFEIFSSETKIWKTLIENGLSYHFNWEASAKRYAELYERALR